MKKITQISIARLFAYFLIYGFLGFVIETIFGIITKGVLESRTSFINAPICGIYGIGATIMIISLQKFKSSKTKIFFVGFIVGTIIEYLTSFLVEVILNVKWWDYSKNLLNINGRVCLFYSVFWGILGIVLIKIINPQIDKFINFIKKKISPKTLKIIIKASILLFVIDFFST